MQSVCERRQLMNGQGRTVAEIHVEVIMQDERGSLLTKGSLYIHFYRADARHEISCRRSYILQPVCERRQLMNGQGRTVAESCVAAALRMGLNSYRYKI